MRYDETLKELLQLGTPQLWQTLAGQMPQEFLTVEFPSVRLRKPDFLARLASGALFHLELQGDNDTTMEWRELEYYLLIYRLLGQPPLQCVLYFGNERLTMRDHIVNESLQFRYLLLDVRTLNHQSLLTSASLADNFLAVLCATGLEAEVIRELARRMGRLSSKEQLDWFEKLMVISGIRGVENVVREEAKNMGISLDIRQNKFYQEAYAAGEASLLTRQLEARFGPLPQWARTRIETADPATLEEAGLRLFNAASLEEVFPQNGGAPAPTTTN
jgi:predicted transposase YdaD